MFPLQSRSCKEVYLYNYFFSLCRQSIFTCYQEEGAKFPLRMPVINFAEKTIPEENNPRKLDRMIKQTINKYMCVNFTINDKEKFIKKNKNKHIINKFNRLRQRSISLFTTSFSFSLEDMKRLLILISSALLLTSGTHDID